MAAVKIIGIMGVSGSGKSTILDYILKSNPRVRLIPTVTDRPARDSEIDREHIFVSKHQFDMLIKQNLLHYYVQPFGLSYRYGARKTDTQPDAPSILMLRSMFIEPFKTTFPGGVLINIHASLETIRRRLVSRGDTRATIDGRLKHYAKESTDGKTYANHTYNHDVMTAHEIAIAIAKLL